MKMTWHDWEPLVAGALKAYTANPLPTTEADLREITKEALADDVKHTDRLIWQKDDFGKAYNAMGQGDMGLAVLRAGQALNDTDLVWKAFKILDVITTAKSSGGLRRTTSSGWWFHSGTSTQKKDLAWTLNQHLFACRELAKASELLAGYPTCAARYAKGAQKGLDQLAGTDFPRWADYKPPNAKRTWAYYGHNGPDGDGYHLKSPSNPNKNGGYHIKCMELVATLAGMGLTVPSKGLPWFLKMYRLKEDEGLFTDSKPSPGGDFHGLVDESNIPSPETITFFDGV